MVDGLSGKFWAATICRNLRETWLEKDNQAYLGGVFHPFRGLMGDPGVTAREGSLLGHR